MNTSHTEPFATSSTAPAAAAACRDDAGVAAYERRFADLLGARYAVAFAYARHALGSLLVAAGLQPGDEVVLSPLTCKVVPLALIRLGVHPVYADIDAHTLNLDPARVGDAIGPRTRAVLFQHTYGSSAGVDAVTAQAATRQLWLIEDCAHCTPQRNGFTSRPPARHAAVYSNNLRKPVPVGSGGVALTNDPQLAAATGTLRDALPTPRWASRTKLRAQIWLHQHVLRPERYWFLYRLQQRVRAGPTHQSLGDEIAQEIDRMALQPSEYQARVGNASLAILDQIASHRRRCCAEYRAALGAVPDIVLPCADSDVPLFYFPVLTKNKFALLDAARQRRVELIAWPLNTPLYGVERHADLFRYAYALGSAPVAEAVARELIGLPTDLATTPRHRTAVIELLLEHARTTSSRSPLASHGDRTSNVG
jgi:dTDP-4-amino-4,6-dideoxygalactose transaminase